MELQDPKMNGALPGGAVDLNFPAYSSYRQEHEGFLPSHSPSPGRKPAQFMDFEGKTSFGMSVFNLSNAIMGSGILGLAYAMAHTGVLFFFAICHRALLLCIALLSSYSIHLLLTCAGVVGIRAYEQLGQRALGPAGKVVVAAVICLHNVGAMSSYLFIIKSELPLVIGTFLDMDPEGDWFLKGNLLIIIVSVLIILPLALMRHLGYLGYTSGLSLTCMLFFLISVIYKKFQLGCAVGHNETEVERKSPPSLNTSCEAQMFTADSQMFYTVPIMAFAFVCHPEVLPIYTELCRPSKRRMQAVANVSIGAMFCMYALTATFGYLTFYSSVEAEMLHMYSQQDLLILCVRLAVLLAVTLTVPVVLFPIRRALQQLLFPSKAFSWPRHVAIALILLVLVNVLVICVPTIRDIFGVIGSTSAPSLIFILPSVFYLRIVPSEVEPLYSWPKIQALCFGILGVLFMAISLGFMFANWATGQSHVSGH
ncbi:sodium-coupled neutral amino acid transporter 5 isoform X3 [Sagmatias obliquidens]|nr:sodium-coupled neutral amino acid transporter 5 isoform X3 [Lagenorhynchus obliquidens]XP_030702574.1 sodium-coupled neutral amino acid transporter 5 isoform X3 [Globicephala melas]XP_033705929.1 sodium-coupled neutral amino acid transporter 5 isoform X4 [Tursiops truncatus]